MPIVTKPWWELPPAKVEGKPMPPDPALGEVIAAFRYWPRGLSKEDVTWDRWLKELAPSPALLKEFKKKELTEERWQEFLKLYWLEMSQPEPLKLCADLARRHLAGETFTLLCYCADESHCHRAVLKQFILAVAESLSA